MGKPDVPSPIDLCDPLDARAWQDAAEARPGRKEMFQLFFEELRHLGRSSAKVLELGSGPGFLADFLLKELPNLNFTLLDISAAMHDLARARLGSRVSTVSFVETSFKERGWADCLDSFDAVITNQAVHELRHKRYAAGLHSEVAGILKAGGPYLVCDHYFGEGGMQNDQLYMTVEEHRQALDDAGFRNVVLVGRSGTLVMHRAA